MIDVVILGTPLATEVRARNICDLLAEYGFGELGPMTFGNRWRGPESDLQESTMEIALLCTHYRIEGISFLGKNTPENVRAFVAELVKLPGVYLECPQCCKERFWTENLKD